MTNITAEAIAEAFNTASPRKNWQARVVTTGTSQYVYFKDAMGMVDLNYACNDGTFTVAFNKAVANFQDYCNAIAKSLVSILSALEAGGLPFVAPVGLEGVEIVITHRGIGNLCTVRYPAPASEGPAYSQQEPLVLSERSTELLAEWGERHGAEYFEPPEQLGPREISETGRDPVDDII